MPMSLGSGTGWPHPPTLGVGGSSGTKVLFSPYYRQISARRPAMSKKDKVQLIFGPFARGTSEIWPFFTSR